MADFSAHNLAVQQQNVLGDLDSLDRIERFANMMATAKVSIPQELVNNPGDCLAVSLQAAAWQMNPFAVAQKTHVIKGKIGYEAQLVNAVVTRWAPIEGRLSFRYSDGWERILGKTRTVSGNNGDYQVPDWKPQDEKDLWCEVEATLKGESEPRTLKVLMVQAFPRQSTNWANDPKQQLAYTAVKRWARLHCPDVLLGIYTPEELDRPEPPKEKDVTPDKGERLKSIMRGEKPAPARGLSPPTDKDHDAMQMAMNSFLSCETPEELEQCGKDLEGLIHPACQDEVRQAYVQRMRTLKATHEKAD